MCPPAHPSPPNEIGRDWSDSQIILSLDEYSEGSKLPSNVQDCPSLYQCSPADLPEGIWYLVQSDTIKESAHGFWNVKGEATKIYSNSVLIGLKATLEYFDGQAPHGQRTDWQMQEYMIAQKESLDQSKKKECQSLCRVFLVQQSSKSEERSKGCKEMIEPKQIADITSNQDCAIEAKDKKCELENAEADAKPNSSPGAAFNEQDCFETGDYLSLSDLDVPLPPSSQSDLEFFSEVDKKKPNSLSEALTEKECFAEGDFLELNDLGDSSSSHSSSSRTRSSYDFSDSERVIGDLQEELVKIEQEKLTSSQYRFNTSVRPVMVVMQPDPLASSTVQERLTERTVDEPETGTMEGTLNFADVASSSGSFENGDRNGKKKKLKMFFCFMLY